MRNKSSFMLLFSGGFLLGTLGMLTLQPTGELRVLAHNVWTHHAAH